MNQGIDKVFRWVSRCVCLSLVVACAPDHFVSMGSDGDDRKGTHPSDAGGSSNVSTTNGGSDSKGCGGTTSGSINTLTGGTSGRGGSSTVPQTHTSHNTGGNRYHLPIKL